MPIQFIHYPSEDAILASWAVREREDELRSLLHKSMQNTALLESITAIKSSSRRKEKIAARLLLQFLLDANVSLLYDKYGGPVLSESRFNCSISHTHDQVVVMLDKKRRIGVDVEHLNGRALRLYSKFMSESEIAQMETDRMKHACIVWSAKEAMYKWYGKKQVSFKENLKVPIAQLDNSGKITSYFRKEEESIDLELTYFKVGEFIYTYCLSSN